MNRILQTAGHATLSELQRKGVDSDLLAHWETAERALQLPRSNRFHFVGRRREEDQIVSILTRGERLAVIQGMGGVGKTALAFHVVQRIQDRFPDGVLWGDFGDLDIGEILENWGHALGIELPRQSGLAARSSRITAALSRKRILLILDDARSLTKVRKLLPSHLSGCSVLVTTRNQEIAVGLVSDASRIISLDPLPRENSYQLIDSIIGEGAVDQAPLLYEEVCQLLGNLPMALMIFAKRRTLSRLSLRESVAALRKIKTRLSRLEIADVAVSIAFEQSWGELSEEEQGAFKQLSLFSGHSFTLEAFQTIFRYERWDAVRLLDQLGRLFLVGEASLHAGRYIQHPLIAAWATEKGQDETPDLRHPYITYFFSFVETHHQDWTALLEEWSHIMLAIDRVIESEDLRKIESFIRALQPIWYRYGYFHDGQTRYERLIDQMNESYPIELQRFLTLHGGISAVYLSEYEKAKSLLNRSLEHQPEVEHDDADYAGDAYFHLGLIEKYEQQLDTSVRHLQQAWAAYQDHPDFSKQADTLFQLADLSYYQGELEQAESIAWDALGIYRQARNAVGVLDTYMLIATVYQEQNRLEDSEKTILEAKAVLPDVQEPTGLGAYYYTAGNLNRRLKKFQLAEEQYKKGLEYFSQCGDLTAQANVLNVLGRLAFDAHDGDAKPIQNGVQLAQASLALCHDIGYSLGAVAAGLTLGKLFKLQGEVETAERTWKEALTLAQEIGSDLFADVIQNELRGDVNG